MVPFSINITVLLTALFVAPVSAAPVVLYETDFQSFPVGKGVLDYYDGWEGSLSGPSILAYGVDENLGGAGNRSGFLGYEPPPTGTSSVIVRRPIRYDPLAQGRPVVEFSCLLGIADSTGTKPKEAFSISIWNWNASFSTYQTLARIIFDNSTTAITRHDGNTLNTTGATFVRNDIALLYVRINFETNRWSCFLDGSPVFSDATFTATLASTRPRNLGTISADWTINPSIGVGDNWMYFDDWSITADTMPQPSVGSLTKSPGTCALTYPVEAGYAYRVEYTDTLGSPWLKTLPGSLQSAFTTGSQTFTDANARGPQRFYRVVRGLIGTPGL